MAPKAAKAPAYQWFPKDAESDETYKLMTCEELGVYERLRDHQWFEGSLPPELEKLTILVGHGMTLRRLQYIWPKIAPCFPDDGTGRIANPRLERQRDDLAIYIAKQKLAGRAGGLAKAKQHGSEPTIPLQAKPSSASATASASASERKEPSHSREKADEVSTRAGRLREESYPAWYAKHRHGARLKLGVNSLEFLEAMKLCETWDDVRLEQLATIVLTTDDDWISRTDRSFKIFALKASWAENRLCEAEQAGV